MWWNKRKLPSPEASQKMLESIHRTIDSLMNSAYSMPTSINRKLEDFLDEYDDLEKDEYEKRLETE